MILNHQWDQCRYLFGRYSFHCEQPVETEFKRRFDYVLRAIVTVRALPG